MHSEAWLEIDQPAMKQMLGREIDIQTMEDHPEKNERNKLIDRQANILKIAMRKVKEMQKQRQTEKYRRSYLLGNVAILIDRQTNAENLIEKSERNVERNRQTSTEDLNDEVMLQYRGKFINNISIRKP